MICAHIVRTMLAYPGPATNEIKVPCLTNEIVIEAVVRLLVRESEARSLVNAARSVEYVYRGREWHAL